MATLYGKAWTRGELLQYASDVSQLGGVRLLALDDGCARGLRVAQFRTGSGLAFDVLLDRGMDVGIAEHNGRPVGWRSAVGERHPMYYQAKGLSGFLRAFHGGLMVGCGLDNVGAVNVDEGVELPLHGDLSNTPASGVSYGGEWLGDEYLMWVQGQMRWASVFGTNLVLTRRISATLGGNVLAIADTIENQGHGRAPYQILYHCNFGYPLLSPESELWVDSAVRPRDEDAKKGLREYNRFQAPVERYPEQVFIHQPQPDADGYGWAALANRALGYGAYVRFRLAELPNLIQWKMMERGTYVLGLEPTSGGVEGRAKDRERGILRYIEPGERVELRVEIGVLPDRESLEGYRKG